MVGNLCLLLRGFRLLAFLFNIREAAAEFYLL